MTLLANLNCPLPIEQDEIVQMAHGGGGLKTARLIEQRFVPLLKNDALTQLGDGGVIEFPGARLAMSTDSFVVSPAFFPGGDIGSLAVHGTVNDLAMCGAEPLALSTALILEEGFRVADLDRVMRSLASAAAAAGVPVVTGDTKVVERGKGDGIYITTTGVGRVWPGVNPGPGRALPGDRVLVSGPVGDHGIAVMAARHGLTFDPPLFSDSASVLPAVRRLLEAVPGVHVLRDPTRGGLATALCEIAGASGVSICIDESRTAVRPEVRAACELLGFDPLYVACEGRFLAIVREEDSRRALEVLRGTEIARDAVEIGVVEAAAPPRVLLKTRIGSHRRLERLSGEQLPRIC
jgi:hydrogenase expression/formation protein HypE